MKNKLVQSTNAARFKLRCTLYHRSPVGYHSKLSKRPYIYTFYFDLSATNIVFVVEHIMEYNYPLIKIKINMKREKILEE
jgi:hypothetical protein